MRDKNLPGFENIAIGFFSGCESTVRSCMSLHNATQMRRKCDAKSGMKMPPSFSSEGHVTVGFMGVSVISIEGDSR
jgi:hypothetical protein